MVNARVSYVEIVWTVLSMLAFYYQMRLLIRAGGDIATLRARKINSVREYAAITTVLLFFFLAFVQFCFVVVGLTLMTQVNPHKAGIAPYTTVSIFLTVSFISATFSFLIERRRKSLLRMLEAIELEDDPEKLKEVLYGTRIEQHPSR